MKKIFRPSIIIATLIIVTIIFAVSTAFTMKYAYHDEMEHYRDKICYISNCASTDAECCTSSWNEFIAKTEDSGTLKSLDFEGTTAFHDVMNRMNNVCSKCRNITITFDMYLNNVTNYTKTDWTTDPMWTDYCSMNQKRIYCFYDDRNVFDSLRLFNEYFPDSAANAIVVLSIGLFIMVIATASVILFFLHRKGSDTHYESSPIYQ